MADMFAVVAERIGGPEVIRLHKHQPVPQPRSRELRIRVAAAGINPIDCARRAGYGSRVMKVLGASQFPLVLGSDFAGVIDTVGSGVSGWQPGERVFGCKGISRAGTHAEFVTVPAGQVLRLPKTLTPGQAACLPYSFVTAYRLIDKGLGWSAEDCRQRRVLVHGGLGAVGSLAVRLLEDRGAVADISDRDLAANEAVSHGGADLIDLSKTPPGSLAGKYDAIINCARFQEEETLFPLLKRGGRYTTIVHPLISTIDEYGWIRGGLRARSIWRRQSDRVRACGGDSYRWVLFQPDINAFQSLEEMATRSLLKPAIADVLHVPEAAAAHARLAVGGLRGKLVLQMS